jgi:hypothetical protein
MQPLGMIMNVKNKVSLFLLPNLFDEINGNTLLPHIGHSNMFKEQFEDMMNFGETRSMASTSYGSRRNHVQDPSWSSSLSMPNIRSTDS